MRTEIYLWIEPLIMNHKRCTKKVYFKCIVEGDHTSLTNEQVERNVLEGKLLTEIMDFADIDSNWDFGVVSVKASTKKPSIKFAKSPEKIKKDKEAKLQKKKIETALAKVLSSETKLQLSKEDITIKDNGVLELSLPFIGVNQKIEFSKIWENIEANILGKIKEGDNIILTDDDGNEIFEIRGGSFLNVGLSDLSIYDAKKANKSRSIFTADEGLKGGLFIRDDGSLDIGDYNRTFYIKINTGNLLKSSLKLNKSLNELLDKKLLKP
jgi:hypothetical protein